METPTQRMLKIGKASIGLIGLDIALFESGKNAGGDRFVEIFVNTPLEVCEERDIKGLYAMARRGEIKGFTGIDDPYEEPVNPEITLNTVDNTPEELAKQIVSYLQEQDFIG